MAQTKEIFFRDADGKVYPVRLPSIDAKMALRFPYEWSEKADKFAERPKHAHAKPVGPNMVVGQTGGDPTKIDRLGVIGPALESAHA